MEFHWMLPSPGTVKVNVQVATPFIPFQNGNTHGLGMIMRNSEGDLIKLSSGVLPAVSPMKNKLNTIHHGMVKAFESNYKKVVVETDNLDTFLLIKNFPNGIPEDVATIAKQIFIILNDPRWKCILAYVYPGRNPIAIYLAKLGGEKCSQLFTFKRPIGAVEELMSLDLGFGHTDPIFKDVEVFSDEEDPVDYGPNFIPPPGFAHGGYAFKEDYYAMDNDNLEGPVIMPVYEAVQEDMIVGDGYNPYFPSEPTPPRFF